MLKNVKTKEKTKRKERLSLNSLDVPEIKDWPIGDEYEVTVKVKMNSIREVDKWDMDEYGYKKGDVKAEFEVLDVKAVGKPKSKKGVYIKTKED